MHNLSLWHLSEFGGGRDLLSLSDSRGDNLKEMSFPKPSDLYVPSSIQDTK